jgi:hypothetical protein
MKNFIHSKMKICRVVYILSALFSLGLMISFTTFAIGDASGPGQQEIEQYARGKYVEGELLIKFKQNVSRNA